MQNVAHIEGSLYDNIRWIGVAGISRAKRATIKDKDVFQINGYTGIVTVFDSLYVTNNPRYLSLTDIVDRIRTGNSRTLIERIRAGETTLKNQLPCICFSGTFSRRANNALIKHSGLVCLDYDNVNDLQEFKSLICRNPYTCTCFISPSGMGLKVIVKIAGNHISTVQSLGEYFPSKYLDLQTDISRVCFESWDFNIYFNEDSLTYNGIK